MESPVAPLTLAHDVFRQGRHPLEWFFRPRGVAVVGATETPGSVGRTLMENLASFRGTVYPVNPKSGVGLKAYLADISAPIDLAVIVTPAATVPDRRRVRRSAGAGGGDLGWISRDRPGGRRARATHPAEGRGRCASSAPTAWAS
jgi:hypothetical protein